MKTEPALRLFAVCASCLYLGTRVPDTDAWQGFVILLALIALGVNAYYAWHGPREEP